jgi:hypothetical protein
MPLSELAAVVVTAAVVAAGLLLLQAATLKATAKPKVILVKIEPVVFIYCLLFGDGCRLAIIGRDII